jgi:hypothetical protein
MPLPEEIGNYDIRVVASQSPDGAVIVDSVEGPFVDLDGETHSPDSARLLAGALIAAADLADQWAAADNHLLVTAKAAVLQAYNALKTTPGNAGDYLRAALDSITDAQAVLR